MLTSRDMEMLRHIQEYGFITINQAHKLFVSNAKYGADIARKRLYKMCHEMQLIKSKESYSSISGEKIYYDAVIPTPHSLMLMDFYAELKFSKAEIISFDREVRWDVLKQFKLRPDAFVNYAYKDNEYLSFVEVVLTHNVDFDKYERLKESGILQEKYGLFPSIIVINQENKRYDGRILNVKYLDKDLNNFSYIVF